MSFCFFTDPRTYDTTSFRRFVSSIKKIYIQLKNSATRRRMKLFLLVTVSLGFKFLGSGRHQLQKTSQNGPSAIIKAFLSAKKKNHFLMKFFSIYWNTTSKKAYIDTVQLWMSFIFMRSLIESGRAIFWNYTAVAFP